MNIRTTLFALALTPLCFSATPARAVDAVHNGALNVPANRIVGLWSTQAAVRPCGSTLPLNTVRNTILFHAGGTVFANPIIPPAGVANVPGVPGINQRGPDLGTWSFNPKTHLYTIALRFDWYVDSLYHGYTTVDREIMLSQDQDQASGPVRTVRYAVDGSVINELCGTAVSQRL